MNDREYQQILDELTQDCADLELFFIATHLKIMGSGGKVLVDRHGHSANRNFANYMISQLGSVNGSDAGAFSNGNINLMDTTGTIRSGATMIGPVFAVEAVDFYRGFASDDTLGTLVGIDDTAFSFNQFDLINKCAQGFGANQVQYHETALQVKGWNGGTRNMSITYTRRVSNSSGATITLKEVGIIGSIVLAGVRRKTMVARDVLGPPVAIIHTDFLDIIFAFNLIYP